MKQNPRERALAEISQLEEKLTKLRNFVDLYDELYGEAEDVAAREAKGQVWVESATSAAANEFARAVVHYSSFATKEQIWDAVRDILRDETEPMHIGYLYKLVTSRGLRISGQNPKGNLSAKLAPLDDVVYIKDKGWILSRNIKSPKAEAPNGHRLNGASTSGNGSDRESLPSHDSNPALRGA